MLKNVNWITKVINPIKKVVKTDEKSTVDSEEIRFNPSVSHNEKPEDYVAWNLRVAAAWAWRIAIVAIIIVAILYALLQIQIVIVPLFIALLLTIILYPMFNFCNKRLKLSRSLSATFSLIIGIVIVFSMFYLASSEIVYSVGDLAKQANRGLNQAVLWTSNFLKEYVNIDNKEVHKYLNEFNNQFSNSLYTLGSSVYYNVLSLTSSITTFFAGMLLTFFSIFFFLKDGRKIWYWTVRLFPSNARVPVHEAAIRGWVTLSSYVKAQIIIAAVDAVSIGLGAYFIGVPLAIPLTILVFLGSFIPIIGSLISGSIAVLVSFVNNGFTNSLIMLAIILIVQQIEGNLLQPLIMSSSVSLHPLAVLLAVTAATFLVGIIGALFVIPVMAFINSTALYLHGYDKFPELETKIDRPGGPPGFLDLAMKASLQTEESHLKETLVTQVKEHENDPPVFHDGTANENGSNINPPIR